jgi:hypothetical protein
MAPLVLLCMLVSTAYLIDHTNPDVTRRPKRHDRCEPSRVGAASFFEEGGHHVEALPA